MEGVAMGIGALVLGALLAVGGCGGEKVSEVGPPGAIHGIVAVENLEAGPGDPANITVYVKEQPALSARTSALGTYTIQSVPAGVYTVVVDPPAAPTGAVYAVHPSGGQRLNVRVEAGLDTVNVNFILEAVPAPPW